MALCMSGYEVFCFSGECTCRYEGVVMNFIGFEELA